MSVPTAIVLDMDGLLIDSERLYKQAWQRAARELGVDLTDEIYKQVIGRSTAEGEKVLSEIFGPALPLAPFRSRWAALWRENAVADGLPSKPGVPELLQFAKDRQLAVAVATSSDRTFTRVSLEAAGLADQLTCLVTGDEVTRGKPAPDIYELAARRLGVSGADCVAFEDSEAGVLAASRAGMQVIMVPDLQTPSTAAVRAATAICPTLRQALTLLASWLDAAG